MLIFLLLSVLQLSSAGVLSDYMTTYLSSHLDQSVSPCEDFYSHVCPSQQTSFGYHIIKKWFLQTVESYNPKSFDHFTMKVGADIKHAKPNRGFSNKSDDPVFHHPELGNITSRVAEEYIDRLRNMAAWQNYLKNESSGFAEKQDLAVRMFKGIKRVLMDKFRKSQWVQKANIEYRIEELLKAIDIYHWVHSANVDDTAEIMDQDYTNCTSSSHFEGTTFNYAMCDLKAVGRAVSSLQPAQIYFFKMGIFSKNARYEDRRIHMFPSLYSLLPNGFNLNEQSAADSLSVFAFIMTHEIAHAIFENERHFDEEEFPKHTECVKRHMKKTCDVFGKAPCHSGALTIGEDTADWAALETTHDLFGTLDWLPQTKSLPLNMTLEQYYFYSMTAAWCEYDADVHHVTPEGIDEHSAPKIRINGLLSQSTAFQKAFNCKTGDRMTTTKEEKCYLFGSMAQG